MCCVGRRAAGHVGVRLSDRATEGRAQLFQGHVRASPYGDVIGRQGIGAEALGGPWARRSAAPRSRGWRGRREHLAHEPPDEKEERHAESLALFLGSHAESLHEIAFPGPLEQNTPNQAKLLTYSER